jgi:hypothetical protein
MIGAETIFAISGSDCEGTVFSVPSVLGIADCCNTFGLDVLFGGPSGSVSTQFVVLSSGGDLFEAVRIIVSAATNASVE